MLTAFQYAMLIFWLTFRKKVECGGCGLKTAVRRTFKDGSVEIRCLSSTCGHVNWFVPSQRGNW